MQKPNYIFDGDQPIHFLSTISGIRFIDDRITGIEYGDNSWFFTVWLKKNLLIHCRLQVQPIGGIYNTNLFFILPQVYHFAHLNY